MRAIRTAALAACLLWPLTGWGQSAVPPNVRPGAAEAPASASHVLAKTVTLNTADAAVFMAIFGAGTGSLPAAVVLTASMMVIGTVVYPVNEYLWDYYSPNTNLKTNNESFDTSASLWRTTYKYLSFKAGVTIAKFGWLYVYTGSVISTVTMGAASTVALPAIFYVNNTAWDWYDWNTAAPPAPQR